MDPRHVWLVYMPGTYIDLILEGITAMKLKHSLYMQTYSI